MSSFPGADDLLSTWKDQVEALMRLWHARTTIIVDAKSRFCGLTESELERRLEADRSELDRWTMMMVLASFEAVVRSDAQDRIKRRAPDDVRKPLRDLYDKHDARVRFEDLLEVWEAHVAVKPATKNAVRSLLKHRHWLAHGRYWTDKSAINLTPENAQVQLDDYVVSLRGLCADFPR